jgi:ankyrin repeat protein
LRLRCAATFNFVSYQQKLATNLRVLDFCSKYDHETSWKQTRKVGNAVLFRQFAEYQQWKDCSSSYTLLLTGKLGSGKSVLLANIVDDINIHKGNKKTTVAYFFCRHDIPESLKARTVLGSFARQLLRTIPDLAMAAEVCNETSSTEDTEKLFRVLQCALPPSYEAYFVLDGLDECDHSERELLAQELQKLQKTLKLLLCISFRVEPNNGLESIAGRFTTLQVTSIPDDNPDIEAFIEAELENCLECQKLVIGDPTLILDIQDVLLRGSQGMFLWVALQIQSLCGMRTDQAIRDALLNLPKDLSETFSRILRKSEGLGQSYQTRILQLITSAYRPLTADELREALSVVPGDIVWTPSRLLNDVYSALACCGCLLIVDEEESTVRFVHHSVKQFVLNGFTNSNNISFTAETSRRTMADIILTYLNYGVFGTELSTTRVPQLMIPSPQSSIIRATMGSSSTIQDLALKMLKSRKRPDFDISKTLAEARKPFQSILSKEFCFYTYAKLYWLKHTVCLSEPTHIVDGLLLSILKGKTLGMSASNKDYQSLLWWAAQAGHKGTVNLIIERGKIDEVLGERNELDLLCLWATDNGQHEIVKLLDKGSKINAWVMKFGNALQAASYRGLVQIVRLLLDKGVSVNAQGGEYGNPLQAASYNGHEQVVKLLLDSGADVNAQDEKYGNPLQAASYNGRKQIVKLLLDKGADVNAQGGQYGNALQAASYNGRKQVVKLLLDNGANSLVQESVLRTR